MRTSMAMRFAGCLALFTLTTAEPASQLPVVDLGYQLQRASAFSEDGQFYSFSNIRYAAPPVGNLRWRAPQPPARNREVDDGLIERICPQSNPGWNPYVFPFLIAYLSGQPFDPSTVNGTFVPAPQDPRETEDCLFLDVFTPKETFQNAGKKSGAPVLVWIYGGGFVSGGKSAAGSPAGLLARGFESPNTEGIVFVAINYRLGAFGFASGPTLQADGVANAGLLDQRFALEWVQKNIKKFGGDPKRVTVIGESGGGSSIMHQITAYGGKTGSTPFQQGIAQSPGFFPYPSPKIQETTFQDFLTYANVKSLDEARKAPTQALITANVLQAGYNSTYGRQVYGPTVDGTFVPALPGQLLLAGKFDRNVRFMTGYNSDEAIAFTDPWITTSTDVRNHLNEAFPYAPSSFYDSIDKLYPNDLSGSAFPYTSQLTRAAFIVAEYLFICNTQYLHRAYKNQTYAYLFAYPPGLHSQDVAYTFYTGNETLSPVPDPGNFLAVQDAKIAMGLQEMITSFAQTGRPVIEKYGADAKILRIGKTGFDVQRDQGASARCEWWQRAPYLG